MCSQLAQHAIKSSVWSLHFPHDDYVGMTDVKIRCDNSPCQRYIWQVFFIGPGQFAAVADPFVWCAPNRCASLTCDPGGPR